MWSLPAVPIICFGLISSQMTQNLCQLHIYIVLTSMTSTLIVKSREVFATLFRILTTLLTFAVELDIRSSFSNVMLLNLSTNPGRVSAVKR